MRVVVVVTRVIVMRSRLSVDKGKKRGVRGEEENWSLGLKKLGGRSGAAEKWTWFLRNDVVLLGSSFIC